MRGRFSSTIKKYSARSIAAGAAFCPACRRRLTDRDSAVCPVCGFKGEDTMRIFPIMPPPLDVIADHAKLFSRKDEAIISKSIQQIRRGFPQIHWRVTTVDFKDEEDVGLFSFWLLNVSPLGRDEEIEMRPWTVLLVILSDGDVAVVPGYAAEVWLSGHDWSKLLEELHAELKHRNYGPAIREFLNQSAIFLQQSWLRVRERTRSKTNLLGAKL